MAKKIIGKALATSAVASLNPSTPAGSGGKGWAGIPPIGKTVIIIGGVAVVGTIGFFTVKYFIDRAKQRDEKKASEGAKDEYEKMIKQGKTLSKPKSTYDSTANTIEKLLDGCETTGSELEVIKNIIKVVKKPVDWAYLKSTFGVRKISDCGSFGVSKTEYDLGSLLNDQLDSFMAYSFVIDGIKFSGTAQESIDILRKYFSSIGVSI